MIQPATNTAEDLSEGDYIIDELHGVGIFRGLTMRSMQPPDDSEAIQRETLVLEYADGDRVYVPAEHADRVHRYVGGATTAPTLNRLKGVAWPHAVARAREHAREVAVQLAALYAERQAAQGPAYGPDTPRQLELEAAFPHTETPDQSAAIADVKRDLEKTRPMDRILVGDVGYGKTEVAVRAAFKAVEAGHQVAVLCPTSVLTAQHYATFSERLAPFGVSVEMLSRLRSPAEQQKVVEGVRDGSVQVVVGTHRLLSEDIAFQELGLVVVDEEQRFGVNDKERLKQLSKNVNVLTLTATPIPRTLHMALAGLRDVSVINDPPEGRLRVETNVSDYREEIIVEAIRRELDRGGQAFFLHNRVETIEEVTARLAELIPGARLRSGHGQMDETALEDTMLDFNERKFDVLVCTTIIEAGVDIPNANTLIVNDADQLGLAQLYQLRGRVGRSDRQAYAIFLYRDEASLSDIARERLSALQKYSDLGSGQKVALRDMELRGAGSLLGLEQSGPVAAVGLDIYLRMLQKEVSRVRGKKTKRRLARLPSVELPVSAFLPAEYIPSDRERLHLYFRMAAVREQAGVDKIRAELVDRYGPLPREAGTLLTIMELRLRCRAANIKEVRTELHNVSLIFRKGRLRVETARRILHETAGEQVVGVDEDRVVLNVQDQGVIPTVTAVVEALHESGATDIANTGRNAS